MHVSRQAVRQELNLSFQFIILPSGSFLSVGLPTMTVSMEYKNLFPRCANAICKIYDIDAILESNLCIAHIFLYDV